MVRPSMKLLFRVTLRTMLVLVAVLSVLLAWNMNQVRQQRKALARVRELGGAVVYDYQYHYVSTKPIIENDARPPGPRWLRDLIGDDYFMSPDFVYLQNTTVTDKEIAELQDALPDCKFVR